MTRPVDTSSARSRLRGIMPCLLAALLSCAGPRVEEWPEPAPEERPEPVPGLERAPIVRVLVLEPVSSVRIKANMPLLLSEYPGGDPLRRFEAGGSFVARVSRGGIELVRGSEAVLTGPSASLVPAGEGNIYLNGKPYRGGFQFLTSHNTVLAVNVVEIDDYLKGVLPSEIGHLGASQGEAYRVQAIASRSYALSKLDEKRGEPYDLKATIMDQVYTGVQGENPAASAAVDETRGLVCIWRGEPVRAYYSACCGGHTADIRVGWPWKDPFPYLHGVRDAVTHSGSVSACRASRHFRWEVRWSGARLEQLLRETLPEELKVPAGSVGRLLDVRVLGHSRDGRVTGIEFVTDRGSHRVMGDRIRWVLRPSGASGGILRSTLFKMEVSKARGTVASVRVRGAGNGHGIGMCQAGAIKLAESGWRAEEILLRYYPGVTIQRYYR